MTFGSLTDSDLPGFPVSTVSGHAGQLVLGSLNGIDVACYQGRVHLYEGVDPQDLRVPTYALKLIGCEALMVTTAVGSTRQEVGPGELVLITDHINMQVRLACRVSLYSLYPRIISAPSSPCNRLVTLSLELTTPSAQGFPACLMHTIPSFVKYCTHALAIRMSLLLMACIWPVSARALRPLLRFEHFALSELMLLA